MISDDLAQQLHDRATRGEKLSADEQTALESWYAQADDAEKSQLDSASAEQTLISLRGQINATLTQLSTVVKRLQAVAAENDVLRSEIVELRHQLAYVAAPQSA